MKTTLPTKRLTFNEWRAYISRELDRMKNVQINRINYTPNRDVFPKGSHSKNKFKTCRHHSKKTNCVDYLWHASNCNKCPHLI